MLIVENGSIVANANSYVDLAYARTYANSLGLTLPTIDAECEQLLLNGMEFIESFKQKFQGHIVDIDQTTQFPRNLVYVGGYLVSNTLIPDNLKKAQVRAAIEISNGTDFFETVNGQFITEETVGPLTTKYSDEFLATFDGTPIYKTVTSFIDEFLVQDSGYRLSKSFGF